MRATWDPMTPVPPAMAMSMRPSSTVGAPASLPRETAEQMAEGTAFAEIRVRIERVGIRDRIAPRDRVGELSCAALDACTERRHVVGVRAPVAGRGEDAGRDRFRMQIGEQRADRVVDR